MEYIFPENCLPPNRRLVSPSFTIPKNSIDCHSHVFLNSKQYPFVEVRDYTPPSATVASYLDMLEQTNMDRGVLVQASVNGTDNRFLLKTLKEYPEKLRGVAVISSNISEDELVQMHKLGVRGVRINILFRGGVNLDDVEKIATKILPFGWHIQFLIDINMLPEIYDRLANLPCIGVIDHMGHTNVSKGIDSIAFQLMAQLVVRKKWWVKLSGAYRICNSLNYVDVIPWAQRLVEIAPEQLVWGSDWPHVATIPMVDTGVLLNQLPLWVPDEKTRNMILSHNPMKLYDFKE